MGLAATPCSAVHVCGEAARSRALVSPQESNSPCPSTDRQGGGRQRTVPLQESSAPALLTTENAFASVQVLLSYQCVIKTLFLSEVFK